jgi:hypothetical protein
MWRKISLYGIPLGIALVAACGGSSSNGNDGGTGGSSSSSGGGGSGDGGGVTCGFTTCKTSEVCCFGAAGQSTCMAAGSCMTSSLTCTAKSMCASGQSCCFTYVGDGGMAFQTGCQDSCDSMSYELCATSADCSNGGFCTLGPYARYCAAPFDGGGFMFPDGGFVFRRRDAGTEAGGDDSAAPPSGDDGSADAPSE